MFYVLHPCITEIRLNLTHTLEKSVKFYFARKRDSKLRSPFRMMNYIRQDRTELTVAVMSLR